MDCVPRLSGPVSRATRVSRVGARRAVPLPHPDGEDGDEVGMRQAPGDFALARETL